jgi:protein-S-isoprenylcysteine O-methyltransferase Ste14
MAAGSRAAAIVAAAAAACGTAAILFLAAGRSDLLGLRAYALLWVVFLVGSAAFADPALARERLRPGPGARESLPIAAFVAGAIWVAHLALAGLDVGRLHWSDSVPPPLRLAGFITLILSLALGQWASRANPFFSSVVRIQSDRGHRLISTGPYRMLRHPGYAGIAGILVSSALALGSWIALAPSAIGIAALVARTCFEERILREGLAGYDEYARRVRYRLAPGVW